MRNAQMRAVCAVIGWAYLRRSHIVFERVNREAEDVVVVAKVKPLTVLQAVVYDSNGGNVVHDLPPLSVEEVVTTIKAPIPVGNRKQAATTILIRSHTQCVFG